MVKWAVINSTDILRGNFPRRIATISTTFPSACPWNAHGGSVCWALGTQSATAAKNWELSTFLVTGQGNKKLPCRVHGSMS
jgi:hypothetical protein